MNGILIDPVVLRYWFEYVGLRTLFFEVIQDFCVSASLKKLFSFCRYYVYVWGKWKTRIRSDVDTDTDADTDADADVDTDTNQNSFFSPLQCRTEANMVIHSLKLLA